MGVNHSNPLTTRISCDAREGARARRTAVKGRRVLMALFVLLGITTTGVVGRPSSAAALSSPGAIRSDVSHWDTDTERYVPGTNGLIHVTLYNSPVGVPDPLRGWSMRDPSLDSSDINGPISPANLPFNMRIERTTGAAVLAQLTDQAGLTLGIGPTNLAGLSSATVPAQISTSTVTYASLVPGGVQLSLHPTVSGLDARLTLSNPGDAGPFTFALRPDSRVQLSQEADGPILATRPISACGSSGCLPDVQQPEYIIESPVLRDSAGGAAQGFTAPVTMTLVPTASDQRLLTLSVDSSWVRDPGRIFPITLDLPIATAVAAYHTGQFGTVSSCAPPHSCPADTSYHRRARGVHLSWDHLLRGGSYRSSGNHPIGHAPPLHA